MGWKAILMTVDRSRKHKKFRKSFEPGKDCFLKIAQFMTFILNKVFKMRTFVLAFGREQLSANRRQVSSFVIKTRS